ncbi:MAG TPA: L,D-transpeptidase family protein [Beijerinckiaceae bacterium]|jgi:murein L,D-transpeptidase YcbB/YkuD
MGATRAVACLALGFGLIAAWAGPAPAEEPVSSEILLPEPPAAPVVIENAGTDRLDLPALPEVTVAVEPAAPPAKAAQAPAVQAPEMTSAIAAKAAEPTDIALPDLPEAPVVFTIADQLGPTLAVRLADPKVQLAPKLSKKDREAIAAFYALGDFKPLFVKEGGFTPAGEAVVARLKTAAEDGLDPADYPVPALPQDAKAADLADAELKLSAAAVLYARDARGARVEPARLSRLITPKLELPAGDAVLTRLAAAKDAGDALASYNPPHAGYRALKAKLAAVRGQPSQARLEGDLLANMERWRWLPPDMGRRHVWVNVPEFKLRLVSDGRAIHEARVIVGKPETPTPLFSDTMEHAIVNPSWYVPPSIFKNEFYSDPAYAASRGYQVVRTRDGGISVRQPPGERNALGFVKFMFPNQHAVYLHDTPNRNLFSAQKRAFSHGCVRLDQPFRFGEFVLGSEWTEARLRSLIGKGERRINLPQKIPVHLTYFTLMADEKGEIHPIADLYAVNNKVRVALGLPSDGTRAVAEAKPKPVRRREAARPPLLPGEAAWADPYYRETARSGSRRRGGPHGEAVVRAPAPMYEQPSWWWVTR